MTLPELRAWAAGLFLDAAQKSDRHLVQERTGLPADATPDQVGHWFYRCPVCQIQTPATFGPRDAALARSARVGGFREVRPGLFGCRKHHARMAADLDVLDRRAAAAASINGETAPA